MLGVQIHLLLILTRIFCVWDLESISGNLDTGLFLDHELVGHFDCWMCIDVRTCWVEEFLPFYFDLR